MQNEIMIYNRSLLKQISPVINDKEILVITGLRRVGKTTLLQQIYEIIPSSNKLMLDMENPLNQYIFKEVDYDSILNNLSSFGINKNEKIFLFLDEIQAVPEIVKPIKYLFDHYNIKFFITGSSSFYIKNLFPESLAGRKYIFELHPLTFDEFLEFNHKTSPNSFSWEQKDIEKSKFMTIKMSSLYKDYLLYGGFPQVVLTKDNVKKKMILQDIFNAYFDKEVKQLADFRYMSKFQDLLFLLMKRVGSKLDISKIAQECSVSRETVYSYLTFLEKTYFIQSVKPFSLNIDREVSGSRKAFFSDHGILQWAQPLPIGTALENAILTQIRPKVSSIHYYQKRNGKEIDFIIDKKIAFEVKETGTISDYNNLKKLCEVIGIKEYYVICMNFIDEPGFIPAWMV